MRILKFGGSSVGTPERILRVVSIIRSEAEKNGPVCVVSSAFQHVTDQLIEVSRRALAHDPHYEDLLRTLEIRHMETVARLLSSPKSTEIAEWVSRLFAELRDLVHGVFLLRELTPRTLDYAMSFGEQLSCRILAEVLSEHGLPATYLDSRTIITTDLTYGSARVNFDLTNWNILNSFRDRTDIPVVTGFIGAGKQQETTTLGRGGSDYTAAILGAALDAEEIQIWTDVDGVMTADPRKVKNAFSLEKITYEEAMELSHFGAKVIHPPTMLPAMNKGINLRILNTFHPEFPGTLITAKKVVSDKTVKGIASIDNVCLISVRGIGIIRSIGIAGRIFSALAKREIDVILITQSSSEQSVCFAVLPHQRYEAREAVELEFRLELLAGEIMDITLEDDYSVIAVVGEETRNIPGIAGKVFQALGKNGINIRAIAQGASELNVTFAVKRSSETKALNALHDNLFLSRFKTVHLFVVGTGLVAGALLDLLHDQGAYARDTLHFNLRVAGLTNRRRMMFNQDGMDLTDWRKSLQENGEQADLEGFVDKVRAMNLANSIVVDCTGAQEVVNHYVAFFESSISIVTSSKLANTCSLEFYHRLRAAMRKFNAQFRYSTNVGAALPILDSLRSILNNGDTIHRIEGVLSGTLSLIFNEIHRGVPFSEAVRSARAQGFTEPDPRIDLRGIDAGRKLLILAREAGIPLELDALTIESLVPPHLDANGSVDEFLDGIQSVDAHYAEASRGAAERGARLMYIAQYSAEGARIGVQEIPSSHPFFSLTGNDNIVALTTSSLYERPLVLRGGGAGAGRTASGLLTDILHVAHGMS
jgi:bifunctional aspartokinase / homoserine dehydrogenase 1